MIDKKYISQLKEELHKVLHYESDTGIFKWANENYLHKIGDRAGSPHHTGYVRLYLFRRNWQDAVLAHLYVTGEFKPFIGRKDKDYGNCKFDNLFVSERKIIVNNKRRRPTRKDIAKGLDGSILTIGGLALKIKQLPQSIREKLNELVLHKYVKRINNSYSLTALGHSEIAKSGDFKDNDSLVNCGYLFHKILPGNLTGCTSEYGYKQAMRKKLFT